MKLRTDQCTKNDKIYWPDYFTLSMQLSILFIEKKWFFNWNIFKNIFTLNEKLFYWKEFIVYWIEFCSFTTQFKVEPTFPKSQSSNQTYIEIIQFIKMIILGGQNVSFSLDRLRGKSTSCWTFCHLNGHEGGSYCRAFNSWRHKYFINIGADTCLAFIRPH